MTHKSLKEHYSRFLEGHKGKLHFAAHSHHFWPDVTRDAHMEYWDDCSHLSDQKWEKVFSEVIPTAQKNIAGVLNLKESSQIVFAPNTHELASRLLSVFAERGALRVLTTSSEFHSWRRQLSRLEELPGCSVEAVSTENLLEDRNLFLEKLKEKLKAAPDLFFISQVFFDSGLALTDQELLSLYQSKPNSTVMVVDGYHAFGALPTDLSALEGKVFYLAGGYKYAQAGEGVGFMVVPHGEWRPLQTGWFAEMGELSLPPGKKVGYPANAQAFLGATQDPSGLYRFNSVWKLLSSLGMNIQGIHQQVKGLQKQFQECLPAEFIKHWNLKPLYSQQLNWHGHFLTFSAQDADKAEELERTLKEAQILVDRRADRLRFGFGLYHDPNDVRDLMATLKKISQ